VKPVRLVQDAILDCSNRGDIVLDAFLGSGTTIFAAQRAGRRGYGIECDPRYVDGALQRLRKFSDVEPIHAVCGLSFDELARKRANKSNASRLQPAAKPRTMKVHTSSQGKRIAP
jgi:hypothetical protein